MHRFRHRPRDLRREVLLRNLKNFAENQRQLTPPRKDASAKSDEKDAEENIKNDSTSLQNPCINNKSDNNIPISAETIASTASDDERDSENLLLKDSEVHKESATNTSFPFACVSYILRSRKKRKKGIVKAKSVVKGVKSPTKILGVGSDKKLDIKSSKKPRSFFNFFKSRGDKRNKNPSVNEAYSCSSVSSPIKTTAQSCQTDISFTDTVTVSDKLVRDNQVLLESNRQLTESLSLLIKVNNYQPSSLEPPSICTDAYCGDSVMDTPSPQQDLLSSITSAEPVPKTPFEIHPQSSRILRSNTVLEKSRGHKICTRSKSLNYSDTSLGSKNRSSQRLCAKNPLSYYSHSTALNQPRSPVLKTLPINSNRGILSRSSMPERAAREPMGPLLRRRSNNLQDYDRSFLSYPLRNNNSLRSSNVPVINVRQKPIVRRSSMPGRALNDQQNCQPRRAIHRRNTMSWTNECNNKRDEFRHPKRFGDLPSEAFY